MTTSEPIHARDELRARLASPGGWGTHGSAAEHLRYAQPVAGRGRRRCDCGCGGRATHVGMANGVALTSGCELLVRRWVRDPQAVAAARARRYEAQRMKQPNAAVRCGVDDCPTPPVIRPVGATLRSVRASLRAQGWRYLAGHPTTGLGRDLCPAHADAPQPLTAQPSAPADQR